MPLCMCGACKAVRVKYKGTVDSVGEMVYCTYCYQPTRMAPTFCVACQICRECLRQKHQRCAFRGCLAIDICPKGKTPRCVLCGMCAEHDACEQCVVCHVKRRFATGQDGCRECKLCIRCGVCPCAMKPDYKALKEDREGYKKRVSFPDLTLRDGSQINQVRVTFHTSSRGHLFSNPLEGYVSTEM